MNIFTESWTWWAIALAVGVPVLLVALTELIGYLGRRGSPAVVPLRLVRNWVVPVGALLGLLAFALHSPADQVWVRVVATVFGFLLILLLLSGFNAAFFARAKAGSWRERIPRIFVEIARLVLVVVGIALLFSWVWGADVGGLIAALGVTSIVIGLALQNAVGGVISGLLLLFEQPFKIGDQLETPAAKGRVVEVNWRAVHIDTGSGIEVIPNAALATAAFKNLSRPAGPHKVSASATFSTDDPPHEVMALLVEVADALPMRVSSERSSAQYTGNGAYTVAIPIASAGDAARTVTQFLAWLWYASRRRGLSLGGEVANPLAQVARIGTAIDALAPVLHLSGDDRGRVRTSSRLLQFGAGETVLAAGVIPDEVYFIVSGRAVLAVAAGTDRIEFARAEPGDIIGNPAHTREKAQSTTTAVDVLTVLAVPLSTLDELVRSRPRLAIEIGQSHELRRQQALQALEAAGISRGVVRLG